MATFARLCESSLTDFEDSCIREAWATWFPAALVAVFLLSLIPVPATLRKPLEVVQQPFRQFLTLPEAAAIDGGANAASEDIAEVPNRGVRKLALCAFTLAEMLFWIARVSYLHISGSVGPFWLVRAPLINVLPWAYAAVRATLHAMPTPPYDLFALHVAQVTFASVVLGGRLYNSEFDWSQAAAKSLLPDIVQIFILLVLILTLLGMPVAVLANHVTPHSSTGPVAREDYATLWKRITFGWVTPLLKLGRNTTLNETDVPNLSLTMQARPVFVKFSAARASTLVRRIWVANSRDLILDFVMTILRVFIDYLNPFFLKKILDVLQREDPTEGRRCAYVYAFVALIVSLAKAELSAQQLWHSRRSSIRVRSELMVSIYEKALKRKDFSGTVDKAGPETTGKARKTGKGGKGKQGNGDRAGANIGKIVNLMSGDATKIANLVSTVGNLYGAPVEIIIASLFLYQILGLSAFVGFLVLLAGWPLNSHFARKSVTIQKGLLGARDKRMSVINELISAVRYIKLVAWEERWLQRTLEAREIELDWLKKSRINVLITSTLFTSSPILISLISFATYVMTGHELTVSTAFTSIALFTMIRKPLGIIPRYVINIMQTGLAINRIAAFLNEDEVSSQVSNLNPAPNAPQPSSQEGLGLENATLEWNRVRAKNEEKRDHAEPVVGPADSTSTLAAPPERTFQLRDISVRFPEGQLSLVTGPTASGKSALLLSLLGEMTLSEGRIIMSKNPLNVDEHGYSHTISYAAQSPWLRHRSIKDNILFGYPFDEERYNDVVDRCALRPDLDIFEDGDETEIGERGITLSGGQKARVALARAVYARTKYVLLDDPLSAVDSHTARALFDGLLCGPLLANRTVVLVTHHVELVFPGSQYLVRMHEGRIIEQGTVEDLRARGALALLDSGEQSDRNDIKAETGPVSGANPVAGLSTATQPADVPKVRRKLIPEEAREEGSVKWRIYNTYLQASGYVTWVVLALLIVLAQVVVVSEKFWMRAWGNAYAEPLGVAFGIHTGEPQVVISLSQTVSSVSVTSNKLPDVHRHPLFYVAVYTGIGLVSILVKLVSLAIQYTGAFRASRSLFKRLLVAVTRAPMRWHDTTPQGRILNRFSKDIALLDTSLASTLQTMNTYVATFVASIVTISIIFPSFLVPGIVIGFVYFHLAVGYLNTGRDLRRMESNLRSPIFSDFGEVLAGIVTVRAFSQDTAFLQNLFGKVDNSIKMFYAYWMINRWLLLRFDVLGALIIFATMLLAIPSNDPGLAGIVISSAMAFTGGVYWTCRYWTDLELDLNSVERVVEYLDLPQEAPAIIDSNRVPAYWPSSSSGNALIKVEDLVIKYAPELPSVIHGVSFELNAKERVGLLGRTGSGKSTLAMSFLRFVEPIGGHIMIDGIDIHKIGLYDLRSRITFIPQDATLISGDLRQNLDPFDEYTDAECLDALRRVHMIADEDLAPTSPRKASSSRTATATSDSENESASVSATSTAADNKPSIGLQTEVAAGGANFSQGQRQLVAMARALLRRSAIIILDEATSSIDFATDSKIQETIREGFSNCLLLTIAHRLKTVIDFSRLIILDQGRVAEFDTPLNLIRKEGGIFRSMCEQSGHFAELETAAQAEATRLSGL